MPIFENKHEDGSQAYPILFLDFGKGDIGFKGGIINNFPDGDNYERKIYIELRSLANSFKIDEKLTEEQAELNLPPALAVAFPANNLESLNGVINFLQELKNVAEKYNNEQNRNFSNSEK